MYVGKKYEKKNIVMIYPKTTIDIKGSSVGLPLSIMHPVSLIDKKKYNIFIIDQRVETDWKIKLEKLLKKDILCVGISAMTGSQIKWALKATKIIRNMSEKIKIVWGGVHPSLLPMNTIKDENVDIIVLREGDKTFPELVNALSNEKKLENVKGICFKKNNKIVITKTRDFVDLNKLPEPDYTLVDINNYFLNLYASRKAISLSTGRGCPHRCSFCYNVIFNKRVWRGLSAKNIIKKIKNLIKSGAKTIDIVDDNFFYDIERVNELIELLNKNNIKVNFVVNCRCDYIARWNIKFLKKLHENGFNELYVGIESGSDRILKKIKKDLTVKQILECNKKLKEACIRPVYSFMIGSPGEKLEDINKTIDLMMKLLGDYKEAFLAPLKVFTPFPGTELYNSCLKLGMKIPKSLDDWGNLDFNTPTRGWRDNNMNEFLEKISYIISFVDGRAVTTNIRANIFLKILIKAYSTLVRLRCRYHFYHFTPEFHLIKILRRFYE